MMTMPNFLLLGAQKAGTTALYYYLNQHPQIYMSPVKEPHFFAFGDGNIDYHDPWFDPSKMILQIEEYRALFSDVASETAIGEASPSYLYNPASPFQIKKYVPDAKMIAILRNPVDRAYSNYLHCRRDGRESIEDFSMALQAEKQRIAAKWSDLWHYKKQGFYSEQVSRYLGLFDREQLLFLLYDDFAANPIQFVQDIFHFLGVDNTFAVDMSVRHNRAGIPKNATYLKIYKSVQKHSAQLKRIVPYSIRQAMRRQMLEQPRLAEEDRIALAREYHTDILQLSELIGCDLSNWLVSEPNETSSIR